MKKFIKKLAKKSEGFTLVELIVVIAILGILAGVAVPAYSGYLTKAKDAAVIVELDAIATAAQAANAEAGAISSLAINADGDELTVSAYSISSKFLSNFQMFYDSGAGKAGDDTDAQAEGDDAAEETGGTTPEPISKTYTLSSAITDFTSSSYKNGATWTNGSGWTADEADED